MPDTYQVGLLRDVDGALVVTGPNGASVSWTKQPAIASPTAPGAVYSQAEATSMKTAVDAIRAALTATGITL